MVVMKFGGTSLANATRIIQAAHLIVAQAHSTKVGVVLSAMAGVTNQLEQALATDNHDAALSSLLAQHASVAQQLHQEYPNLDIHLLMQQLQDCVDNAAACYAQELTKTARYIRVITLGERLSIRCMLAVLKALGQRVQHLPAEQTIQVQGKLLSAEPDIEQTRLALIGLLKDARIYLTEGFYGWHHQGEIACLGRNGSDLSAAVLAAAMNASQLEIWTDVDGVYTADPNVCEQAQHVEKICFEILEAFARLGARVIYAPSLACIKQYEIPITIKNTLKPDAVGTQIEYCPEQCPQFLGTCLLKDLTPKRLDDLGWQASRPPTLDTSVLFSIVGNARKPKRDKVTARLAQQGITCYGQQTLSNHHSESWLIPSNHALQAQQCVHHLLSD